MSKYIRTLQLLNTIIDWTGVVIVVTTISSMFLALLINVFLRYFLGDGIAWAYEIHNILFPWLVAGGAVMASARGSNIAVTALIGILPELLRRIVAIGIHGFVAALSIGIVISATPIVKAAKYSRLAETGIPQMYGYWSLLYAFSAMAAVSFFYMLQMLLGEKAKASDPTASKFS